jgi:glutamyl/glutaminyl-tRNA synthetase
VKEHASPADLGWPETTDDRYPFRALADRLSSCREPAHGAVQHLIARKAGGTFILRLDDTDPERSKPEFADAIQEDLEWLGITWDRLERQSDRLDRYAAAADELRAKGRFYEAFETPTELDLKRKKQLNMGLPPVYDRAALEPVGGGPRQALRTERGPGVWRFKLDRERIEWWTASSAICRSMRAASRTRC